MAKPDNGKGGGNGHGNSESNMNGNSNSNPHVQGGRHSIESPMSRGQATAALARMNIHSSHYQHKGGVRADAMKTGNFEVTGVQARQLASPVRTGLHSKQGFSKNAVLKDFASALEKIRAKGNNSGKLMLDPYGLVKDDRKEIYGNRGRPIQGEVIEPPPVEDPPPAVDPPPVEEPPPAVEPPPPPPPEPQVVSVTQTTVSIIELMVWNGQTVTRQLLSDQGYTSSQIDFLLTLSLTQLRTAASGTGTIPLP
ncbi:MAG: hypothetical protein PHN49_11125 [Candidatus Omnitrophica bacterium]|nr:hypothetical protein [Candidatus Omnitrophota bacterium]MDD5672180.1 hypothetical protein [Candidatus Omnitrophota bacterium]